MCHLISQIHNEQYAWKLIVDCLCIATVKVFEGYRTEEQILLILSSPVDLMMIVFISVTKIVHSWLFQLFEPGFITIVRRAPRNAYSRFSLNKKYDVLELNILFKLITVVLRMYTWLSNSEGIYQ